MIVDSSKAGSMSPARYLLILIGCLLVLTPTHVWAQKNVDLELVTEPGAPLATSQKWLAALGDLGVASLRIRAGRSGDRAEVTETGTKQSPSFTVTGLITKRDQLVVPGASFSMQQKGELKAWLAKLGTGKATEPKEETTAFGLNDEQLLAVHDALAGKVSFETKGQPVGDVARKILKELALTTDVDPEVRRVVDAGEVVHDDLKGVSYGTALAATLRPAGLVFAPVKISKTETRLRIADSRNLKESWPIGWPAQQGLSQTLPAMSKFINVEISDVVLADALTSIQGRVQAPFLFDHNGLARQQIDPATLKVSLPKGKTYYKAILDRLLAQAHLKCEVRVDEAEQPLVWISTVK